MLEGYRIADVEAVIIATVVPRALHNLQVLADKYFRTTALVAGQAPVEWGIALDVAEPASVGADRVVNAIAAHHLYQEDLIVIDFRQAPPLDVLDYHGDHKGDIIAPAIQLPLGTLLAAAAHLDTIAHPK